MKQQLMEYFQQSAYVKLAPSPIEGAGVGVLALRTIPCGVDPFAGPNPQPRDVYIPMQSAELARMPTEVREYAQDFFPLLDESSAIYAVPANGFASFDSSWYVNHSDEPNVRFEPVDPDEAGSGFVTLRAVDVGEELLMDYRAAFPDLHARLTRLRGGAHAVSSSGLRRRAALPRMLSDADRTFGRCEFWAAEKATALQVVNVLGRFGDSAAWAERTDFATLEDDSADTTDQAATEKRNAFAKRFDQVERVAFMRNVPSLPFIDERLASDVGASVESFAAMPVEPAHLAVVFDALAHSKTTLVKRSDADERIASWRASDGGFDADAFGSGLRTGLVSVLAANAVLYFFVASGVAVVARVGLDIASGK